MIINKPITLYFEPISLDVKYQKCLKIQIAIFRLSIEQAKGNKRALKMDKTEPVKFTNPHQKITFSKTLSLLTTLPFNSETQNYENKEVDFELAWQIDGEKGRMGKKISLKDLLMSKTKSFKFIQEKPLIILNYKAEVKLQDERAEKTKRLEQPKEKEPKIIKFETDIQNTKQNLKIIKQESQYGRPQRVQKGRHKTVFFQPTQEQLKIQDNHSQSIKKHKSANKFEIMQQISQKQSNRIAKNVNTDLSSKLSELKEKYLKLQKQFELLGLNSQQNLKKMKEKDGKIQQLTNKNQMLEQRILNQMKSLKKDKQQLKKQQSINLAQQNQVILQLRQEIKDHKIEIEQLRKTTLNFQQSTKHIATGSQQQIRLLKQKIQNLEKQNHELCKQCGIYEQSLKSKEEIISDLKSKIYIIDKQNLQLQQKLKSLQNKMVKIKQQYTFQIEELQSKIDEMKEQNKTFKIATLKDIKDDNSIDYKKKVEALEKQLEKKQQLLKKMTQMKKENQSQKNSQIIILKKELSLLKEDNQKLSTNSNSNNPCSDIEIKIQVQKLKKELDTCRKNEKALLIQKGKLQANNRSLQDDIVKNKCSIANILNAVQQTGNQKLITEVYTLTQ